jgi:hypothetical protein
MIRPRSSNGDLADVAVEGKFDLVFVAYNTCFALQIQDEQVRCLRNVAGHLVPGGAFVIEAFVPNPTRWERGQQIGANRVDEHSAMLAVSTHNWDANSPHRSGSFSTRLGCACTRCSHATLGPLSSTSWHNSPG